MPEIQANDFLPQRSPFQFVDTLICVSDENTSCRFQIKPNTCLLINNSLSEGGLLENMAQSAAAAVGYNLQLHNMPIQLGYIGAIKKIRITQLPQVGEVIETHIYNLSTIGNASIIKALIFLGEKEIAGAELTIFGAP